MKFDKELLKGNSTLIVLKCLEKNVKLLSEKEEQWRIFTMGMNNILNERIILIIVYNKLLFLL